MCWCWSCDRIDFVVVVVDDGSFVAVDCSMDDNSVGVQRVVVVYVAVEPVAPVAERVYPSFHVRYHLHFSTESRTIHSLEMKQQRKSLQYSSQIREDPTIVAFVVVMVADG